MRTEGRTDMTKQMVAFRNFANASKNPREARSRSASQVLRTFQKLVHRSPSLPPIAMNQIQFTPHPISLPPILLLSFPILIYRGSFRSAIMDSHTQYPRRFHGVVLSGVVHNVINFYIKGYPSSRVQTRPKPSDF